MIRKFFGKELDPQSSNVRRSSFQTNSPLALSPLPRLDTEEAKASFSAQLQNIDRKGKMEKVMVFGDEPLSERVLNAEMSDFLSLEMNPQIKEYKDYMADVYKKQFSIDIGTNIFGTGNSNPLVTTQASRRTSQSQKAKEKGKWKPDTPYTRFADLQAAYLAGDHYSDNLFIPQHDNQIKTSP